MYAISPPRIYALADVLAHPEAAGVLERIRSAVPTSTPFEVVEESQLAELFGRPELARMHERMGMHEDPGDPALLLALARYDGRLEERLARQEGGVSPGQRDMLERALGYRTMNWFSSGVEHSRPCEDHVCRPAWRINLMRGCPHRCFYCGLGRLCLIIANAGDFVAKLAELAAKNPWQKTFLYDDIAEAFAFEPEMGAVRAMAEFFARTEDQHQLIHTKSANVDFLRDIDHRGRTIIVWSLTPETQSTRMEALSATTEERIEAARKCQSWGYPVRFKYKPIVPVNGWRDEIAAMTRRVFERTKPDVISLFMLAWMSNEELVRLADLSLLDPRFVSGAAQAAESMGTSQVRPFPHDLRREVYEFCLGEIRRYDAEVPVSLSTETLDMWRDMSPLLGLTPGTYPCGCGPTSTPGLAKLPCVPWSVAEPVPVSVEG